MNDNEITKRNIDIQINIHKTKIRDALDVITECENQITNLQAEKANLLEELGSQQSQTNSSDEKDDLNLDFSSIKNDSGEDDFKLDDVEQNNNDSATES